MAEHADSAGMTGVGTDDRDVDTAESAQTAAQSEDSDDPSGAPGDAEAADEPHESPRRNRRLSTTAAALVVGVVLVAVLGSLTGWLGWTAIKDRQADDARTTMIDVARQGAVNLTTIDFNEVDADIARILNSSMGTFHDDFQQRAQPFVDVVKQAQSKSVGTVTEAGLESQDGDRGRVLVAVSVTTSNVGGQDQPPRSWRMRIDVQKADDTFKVSDVQFVP